MTPLNSDYVKVICYLKEEMRDYLSIPTPYLIGVPQEVWAKIGPSVWEEVSEDTVAFQISTQKWMFKEEFGDHALQGSLAALLENSLLEISHKQI